MYFQESREDLFSIQSWNGINVLNLKEMMNFKENLIMYIHVLDKQIFPYAKNWGWDKIAINSMLGVHGVFIFSGVSRRFIIKRINKCRAATDEMRSQFKII